MTTIKTDICVIGAGSGGLSVASGAVQMGARVVLIEAGEMGGDCLNHGCVPSKALLHAGRAGMGWGEAHEHVRKVIETIAPHDSQERFEGLGCTVIRARARFTGPRELVAGDTTVRARRFVIATGSRPMVPDIPGLAETPHWTNETIFSLAQKPDHLLILGGGPIGLEMAQAHRRLGCEVTVLEADRALAKDDPEAVAVVLEALRRSGIRINEGAAAVRVRDTGAGVEIVTDQGATFTGSHLLVATGRVPSTKDLGLEAAGVEVDARGAVQVNARLRSANRRIYALGDVTGGAQFTHVAGYQAGVAIRPTVLRLPARARTDHIPWVTYTDPELAHVGMTEAEARAAHGDIEVLRADFSGNDRAVATGDTTGFLKLWVHKGKPLGATIVGTGAGELIAPWSLAISKGLKLSDISGMVLPYPTRSEISKRAAGNYFTPKLFENDMLKRMVRLIQRLIP